MAVINDVANCVRSNSTATDQQCNFTTARLRLHVLHAFGEQKKKTGYQT